MSRIIITTVYTPDELSATAREKAREWYRQHHADSNWYENVYEDFRTVCEIVGIALCKMASESIAVWHSNRS
ncbi:hypothetical protein IXY14_25485 [Escherichia coli]